MASVLYYGVDDRIPKMMDEFFQARLKEAGESNSIMHAKNDEEFDAFLTGMAFDMLFVEHLLIPGNLADWVTQLRKKRPNVTPTMMLVGGEQDPIKLMKIIDSGWIDYLHLPPDKPILIEKIFMYTMGRRSSELRQVYSMQMATEANLARPGILEELSEFDCKVRSPMQVPDNELLILYSPLFAHDGQELGRVLGRCYNSTKHEGFKGMFQNSFYFVGVSSEALTTIRKSLRRQFVSGKPKT